MKNYRRFTQWNIQCHASQLNELATNATGMRRARNECLMISHLCCLYQSYVTYLFYMPFIVFTTTTLTSTNSILRSKPQSKPYLTTFSPPHLSSLTTHPAPHSISLTPFHPVHTTTALSLSANVYKPGYGLRFDQLLCVEVLTYGCCECGRGLFADVFRGYTRWRRR